MTALKNTTILVLALAFLAGSPIARAADKDSKAAKRILLKVGSSSALEQRMFYRGLHLSLHDPDVARDTLAGIRRGSPLAQGIRLGQGIKAGSIRLSQGQTDFLAGTLEGRGVGVAGTPLSNRTVSGNYTRGVLTGQALTASQVAGRKFPNNRVPGTGIVVHTDTSNPALTGGAAGGTITIPDIKDRGPALNPRGTLTPGGSTQVPGTPAGSGNPDGTTQTPLNSPATDSPTIPDMSGRDPVLTPHDSPGGNGGGGGTPVNNTPTTTTQQLPDGTLITTTTTPDGTVTTQTHRPDGTVITTTTHPDGSTTTELTGGPAGGVNTGGPDSGPVTPINNPPTSGGGDNANPPNSPDPNRPPPLNPNPNPPPSDDDSGNTNPNPNPNPNPNTPTYQDGYNDAMKEFEKHRYDASGMQRLNSGISCAESLFGAYVSRQAAVAAAETAGNSVGLGEGVLGPLAYAAPGVPDCYTAFTGEYPQSDWLYGLSAAGRAYRLYDQYRQLQRINEARDKAKQQSQYPPGSVVVDNAGNPVGVVGQDGQIRPIVQSPRVPQVGGGGGGQVQRPTTVGGGQGTGVVYPNGQVRPANPPVNLPTVDVPAVGGGDKKPTQQNTADAGNGEPKAPAERPGTSGDVAKIAKSVEVLCGEWDFNCMWRSDSTVTTEEYENLTKGLNFNDPSDMFFKSCIDGYPGNPPPDWWIQACATRRGDMGDTLAKNDADAQIQGKESARDMRRRLGSYVQGVLQNYDGPATQEAQREFFQNAGWTDPQGNLNPAVVTILNGGLTPDAAFNLGKKTGEDWTKFGRHIASALKAAEQQRQRNDALQKRLDAAETRISALEGKNTQLVSALQDTQSEIAKVNQEIGDLESAMDKIQADVAAGKLDSAQVAERLGNYEQQLNERMKRLDGLTERLGGQLDALGVEGTPLPTGAVVDEHGTTVVPAPEVATNTVIEAPELQEVQPPEVVNDAPVITVPEHEDADGTGNTLPTIDVP